MIRDDLYLCIYRISFKVAEADRYSINCRFIEPTDYCFIHTSDEGITVEVTSNRNVFGRDTLTGEYITITDEAVVKEVQKKCIAVKDIYTYKNMSGDDVVLDFSKCDEDIIFTFYESVPFFIERLKYLSQNEEVMKTEQSKIIERLKRIKEALDQQSRDVIYKAIEGLKIDLINFYNYLLS